MAGVLALAILALACGTAEAAEEEISTGIETAGAEDAAAARAGLRDNSASDSAADAPTTTTSPPITTYPEITADTTPPAAEERALITPTGVLVGLAGRTDAGFVVETPCGGLTEVAVGQVVSPMQVVIDPGHGGDEDGAVASTGLTEAELNLALARRTRDELDAKGIASILTRDGDYRIPITQRAALADRIAPAAFISIHHNTPASRPSETPGTEVYVQNGSEVSRRLGGLLYEEVFTALDQFDIAWTSRDDAGVLVVLNSEGDDSYGIARYPTTPSALVELAYLGNDAEVEFLATQEYLDVAAAAMADALERFLTTDDPGSGFVDEPRIFDPSGLTGGSTGCVDPALQ